MRAADRAIRVEWLVVAAATIAGYAFVHGSWLVFALLILAPDLAMLFYLAGPRTGALAYNAVHLLVWPVILLVAGILWPAPAAMPFALIWLAHIAIDRALGYGLKYDTGFRDTHLGRIGRA